MNSQCVKELNWSTSNNFKMEFWVLKCDVIEVLKFAAFLLLLFFFYLFSPLVVAAVSDVSDTFSKIWYFHATFVSVKKISKRNLVAQAWKSSAIPSKMGMELQGARNAGPRSLLLLPPWWSLGVNTKTGSTSRSALFPPSLRFWQCCVCSCSDIWSDIWSPCVPYMLLRPSLICAPNLHLYM